MEKQRISPEVAYVKSKDLLVGGMSDVVVAREKVKFYQKVSIFSSLAIGALLGLTSQNLAAFVTPIVMINGSVLPYSIRLLRAFKEILEKMGSDKKKLETGAVDPREYYEARVSYLKNSGKSHIADSLNGDTSRLTSQEREMLSKFSDDSPEKTK